MGDTAKSGNRSKIIRRVFQVNLYSEGKNYKLYHGSMLDMLEVIEPNSIDAIVTDPPYELNFMGKGWDNSGIAFQKETWEKCYTTLKSGGYLLAFGGTRTYHRIACAIEDAGFEIRDTIMWLYGSGFPKSMNIGKGIESKLTQGSANPKDFKTLKGEQVARGSWGYAKFQYEQGYRDKDYDNEAESDTYLGKVDYQTEDGKRWDGWGTALKPAYEPIIVARKPCEGSCIDNVLKYGVGGINIDECRIGVEERTYKGMSSKQPENAGVFRDDGWQPKDIEVTVNGRFPSNVILTYDETDQEEVCGGMPTGGVNGTVSKTYEDTSNIYGDYKQKLPFESYGDSGNASRYYYCAKASQKDRDEGLEDFELQRKAGYGYDRGYMDAGEGMFKDRQTAKRNTHPTVKPCELMQYLIRLVTPKGGIVLDPFNGSGSTGKACMYENRDRQADYSYIGIELTEEYLPIADARISVIANQARKRRLI